MHLGFFSEISHGVPSPHFPMKKKRIWNLSSMCTENDRINKSPRSLKEKLYDSHLWYIKTTRTKQTLAVKDAK